VSSSEVHREVRDGKVFTYRSAVMPPIEHGSFSRRYKSSTSLASAAVTRPFCFAIIVEMTQSIATACREGHVRHHGS